MAIKEANKSVTVSAQLAFIYTEKDAFSQNMKYHINCLRKETRAMGSSTSTTESCSNKKDGYRQQNVRQRQKLISIIDYDVCILEYLQPFWRFSTSKIGLTLKSGYGVLQGQVIEKGAVR